ncbi:hypothetical protein ACFL0N_03455 [Pseudomonadota bacterium]
MVSKKYFLMGFLAAMVFLAGCAGSQSQSAAAKAEKTPEPAAPAVDTEIVDVYNGDGLKLPLDGSSVDAFNASMARVKRYTTEIDYQSLNSAIGYMMVYDLEVRGKKEVLVGKLNGKTGYEVIDMIDTQRVAPEKKPTPKSPAESKTIDT